MVGTGGKAGFVSSMTIDRPNGMKIMFGSRSLSAFVTIYARWQEYKVLPSTTFVVDSIPVGVMLRGFALFP